MQRVQGLLAIDWKPGASLEPLLQNKSESFNARFPLPKSDCHCGKWVTEEDKRGRANALSERPRCIKKPFDFTEAWLGQTPGIISQWTPGKKKRFNHQSIAHYSLYQMYCLLSPKDCLSTHLTPATNAPPRNKGK